MPKPKLFEEEASDSDVEIKTNNDYATKYDTWREKEELNRLKNKYGDHARLNLNISEDESSSSEDDEDGKHLTEEFEKDFFKTLAYLKRKDPKIYDDKVVFFEKILGEDDNQKTKNKSKKQEPMFMKDYERKMILEKGAKFEDSDEEEPEEDPRSTSPTYVEEQRRIKESLKKAVDDEDDNDEKWGGLFEKRKKTKEEQQKEEEDYMKWLKGTKEHLQNEEMETELNSLKEYWNKPDLNKDEAFLRDYLLNKKYLEKDDENHIPTYEEIIHDSDENLSEDEKNIEKQEEFEVKYNFRYEEPDQEFIKRYPRTMEHSVRKTDDRRKLKRAEIKERKEEEKKQKQVELKQLKILKRREIQEKIKMIKDITGNEQMAFQDMDIEGDFDPEEHDRRMQELFNDEYYGEDEGDQKPEFSDLEEELGPWKDNNELHCEDEDFNMDCDYNPETVKNKKEKKKRDRPGKKQKNKQENEDIPLEENEDQYGEYMDELYKLDYEDMIGDIPCRFKYRDVVPNDFGLSVEEILIAKDKELNRWCSLKKTTQYRPEQAEKYDVIAYRRKAANEELKKKYLPSLYEPLEEELNNENSLNENTRIQFNDTENNEKEQNNENKKSKKKKKNKNVKIDEDLPENSNEKSTEDEQNEKNENIENSNNDVAQTEPVEKSPKKKKTKHTKTENNDITRNKINENISNLNQEKTKKKNKTNNSSTEENENNTNTETSYKKSKNKNKTNNSCTEENENNTNTETSNKKSKKQNKTNNSSTEENENNTNTETSNKKSKNKINNSHTEEIQNNANIATTEETPESKKMSRRQKKNKKILSKKLNEAEEITPTENRKRKLSEDESTPKKKQKINESTPKKKQKINGIPKKKQKFNNKNKKFKNADKKAKISDSRLEAYGINPKKFKNKLKYKNKNTVQ